MKEEITSVSVSAIQSKLDTLTTARDQLRLQLSGVENQIYVLNQLLNPEPPPAPTPEPTPAPAESPPGTI